VAKCVVSSKVCSKESTFMRMNVTQACSIKVATPCIEISATPTMSFNCCSTSPNATHEAYAFS
jgi:hypothetical protein